MSLPRIHAVLEGWPIDVPFPGEEVGVKDKGINDLKDMEAKSLIAALREGHLYVRL